MPSKFKVQVFISSTADVVGRRRRSSDATQVHFKKCIQVIKRLKKREKEASSEGYFFHYCVSDSALEHLAFGSSSTEKKCFAEAVADGAQLEIVCCASLRSRTCTQTVPAVKPLLLLLLLP